MSWLPALLEKNSGDPRTRLELGEELIGKVATTVLPNDGALLNDFADLCIQWISSSNFKVALLSFDIMETALRVSGEILISFLVERLFAIFERLGDTKQCVRDGASSLILYMLSFPSVLPVILDRITVSLSHRQWLVRIGTMRLLPSLAESTSSPPITRFVPLLCRLTSDANAEVREASMRTMAELIAGGQPIDSFIRAKGLLPEPKISLLLIRGREVHLRDRLRSPSVSDAPRLNTTMFREPRLPVNGKNGNGEDQENALKGSARKPLSRFSAPTPSSSAGAVQEADFKKHFTDVPRIQVLSAKDLITEMEKIRATLSDTRVDWDKRVSALKMLRSLLLNGALDWQDTFLSELALSGEAILTSVTDLRSQVCKEACLTVSYLSEELGGSMFHLTEQIMPALINLIQNSAKIMSSSAQLASIFLIRNVQNPKLIPIILNGVSSKSKDIRGETQNLIGLVLQWDPKKLEKHVQALCEGVKRGICDADPAARSRARVAYSQLESVFPRQAQILFQSLDGSRQKSLSGALSQSSSSQSIVSEKDSTTMSHRPGLFGLQKQKNYYMGRSTSEIDPGAARRAHLNTPTRITPRRTPLKPAASRPPPPGPPTSSNRPGTFSQPGSRSNSPSRLTSAKKKLPVLSSREGSPKDLVRGLPRRVDSASLTAALHACTGNDKREGIQSLRALIQSGMELDKLDVRKVFDTIVKLLSEGTYKLSAPVCQLLDDLVTHHHQQLGDFLHFLLIKLHQKMGSETLPNVRSMLASSMVHIRQTFDPQLQLYAVCRNIRDPISTATPKVKMEMLKYLHELSVQYRNENSLSLNREDVKAAVAKLFQWMEDPRLAPLRQHCETALADLFSLSPSDFSSLLSSFTPQQREMASRVTGSSYSPMHSSGHPVHPTTLPASPRQNYRDGISQVTAQISEFVLSSPSLPTVRNGNSEGTMSFATAADQQQFISEKLADMGSGNRSRENEAVLAISSMLNEGSFTLWQPNFKPLILNIFEMMGCKDDPVLKKNALKLLSKICHAQASRFYELAEICVCKLLSAITGEENTQVIHVAEECAKNIATHLPPQMIIRSLNPVISQEGEGRAAALKMLTRLVEHMDNEDLASYVKDIAPPIVAAFVSDQSSSVRKTAVYCLVAIHNKLGSDPLQEFLSGLETSKMKLFEVYTQRAQTASNHF